MAAKLNQKPSIPPDRISAEVVRDTVDVIREKRQVLSDAQMGHAGEYKAAEKRGLHNKALKLVVGMAKEEPSKRMAFYKHFTHYVAALELDKDPQRSMFEEDAMPSASDVADAVGPINNGVSMADVPAPKHPPEFEGKKRMIGAWNKGVEARRDGEKRTSCLLTGAESVKVFEAGWDAMDAAVVAALNGATVATTDTGTIGGFDLPEGMSRETFTALFKDGAALFRSGKSPGEHVDADDPAKARVLQLGWASEQDAQRAAQDVVVEPTLSPEDMQAAKEAGATASRDGKPRSECPYADGTVGADLWLEGFEEQDDALFDSGVNSLTATDGDDEPGGDAETGELDASQALADADDAATDDLDVMEPPTGDEDEFPVGAMAVQSPAEIFAAE